VGARADARPELTATSGARRYTIISADCHAGANMETYEQYLDPAFREEFAAWRGSYTNPFRDLQGGGRTRNWDSRPGNAAALYGFDLAKLDALAAEVGPTTEEIDLPLEQIPADASSPAFSRD
jgi:hypothetical protein